MIIEQKIKDYFKQISSGKISITHQQAREIINLITDTSNTFAVAKFYRYEVLTNTWRFLYTVKTSNEKINDEIKKALELVPIYNFYLWELYNDVGEFQGNIYTVKNQLF